MYQFFSLLCHLGETRWNGEMSAIYGVPMQKYLYYNFRTSPPPHTPNGYLCLMSIGSCIHKHHMCDLQSTIFVGQAI
jgi:hypothetical protein